MPRRFYTLDVFTSQPLAGNPLAVVLDAEGLAHERMMAITREFNLSETVFVGKPVNAGNRASLRIFTPGRELPFAGHPTVGTAVLLGLLDGASKKSKISFGLEEKVGLVSCEVETESSERGRARFTLPRLPQRLGTLADIAALARGLGLAESDIGYGTHRSSIYSAGVAFACVPLRNRDAVTKAKPSGSYAEAFTGDAESAFVYCADPLDKAHSHHTRMFAPTFGIAEDPATGAAAAAFAGVIMESDTPKDGEHEFVIEQGDAMGRPSRIGLRLSVTGGKLQGAGIGGEAVIMSEGSLRA
jgi:trans-2,3-dihydro-3-hydroxyanthranilate isomerase